MLCKLAWDYDNYLLRIKNLKNIERNKTIIFIYHAILKHPVHSVYVPLPRTVGNAMLFKNYYIVTFRHSAYYKIIIVNITERNRAHLFKKKTPNAKHYTIYRTTLLQTKSFYPYTGRNIEYAPSVHQSFRNIGLFCLVFLRIPTVLYDYNTRVWFWNSNKRAIYYILVFAIGF